MQRVKLPAGVISSSQARTVCLAADRFGRGGIHLTTRGSMEIHWLREADLPAVKRLLSTTGLSSRGACGGAVRGITCGTQGTIDFPQIEALAHKLQRHFTGNPRFERLPKKFKIGIESSIKGRRHLIQDAGLVLNRSENCRTWYDLWVAGGLGREPQPGFLLATDVAEERVIPLLEAILRVYEAHTPAGKRLKHLLNKIGEEEFRRLVDADPAASEELPPFIGIAETTIPAAITSQHRITAHFFAGMLSSKDLLRLADFADIRSDSALMVTANQDIAFHLPAESDTNAVRIELKQSGFSIFEQEEVTFRICPGTHECRVGLTPTREIARAVLDAMGPAARKLTWAISGCHNSCTQPQLADIGIISSRLVAGDDGRHTPRFDLYSLKDSGFGKKTGASLNMDELIAAVQELS